jgi:hypothetical protein
MTDYSKLWTWNRCRPELFSVPKADCVPAHKQTDPAKAPGQVVNPLPESMLYKPTHGGYPSSKDQA